MGSGAMALGIIGGVIGLLIGIFGYTLGGLAGMAGMEGAWMVQAAVIGLPVASIVGGAMAKSRPIIAAVLMAASAIALLAIFGFGFLSAIPIALSGAGAVLAVLGAQERPKFTA